MEKMLALTGLDRVLDAEKIEKLHAFQALLTEKNRQMDLTSVPEEEIPLRHFGDSLLPLTAHPSLFPRGASLADVGTGAGFPGVPIAVFREDLSVTLLESMRRRCDFLLWVTEKLALKNTRVICLRAEEAGQREDLRESFLLTVSRAVASAPVLLEYLLPLTAAGGRALCWKGPAAAQEAREAEYAAGILGGGKPELLPVSYPGEERYLLCVEKTGTTPPRYPRRTGIPLKRPLCG